MQVQYFQEIKWHSMHSTDQLDKDSLTIKSAFTPQN